MPTNPIAALALRAVPGALVLDSGLGKLSLDEASAGYLQAEAAKGIPALGQLDSRTFGKVLSYGELAVGGALLTPFVPNRVAGLALGGFTAGLLSIYFRDPEKTRDDGVRPSSSGIPMSKDSWLAAIAVALVAGGSSRRRVAAKSTEA